MRSFLVASIALASACTGVVIDPIPGRGPSPDSCTVDPGATTPFRRLTRDEYDNTIRDLLDDDSRPARAFPPDETGLGFDLGATVSPLHLELYANAAETLAARAATRADLFPRCEAADTACIERVVRDFATRAYRRPIEDAQLARLLTAYDVGAAAGSFEEGLRLVIAAALQSPYFLYRVELGGAPSAGAVDVVPLTAWERATRLSYLLWQTMPDDALFAAAAAGELDTPDQVAEHARRMLDDARARDALRTFYLTWLDLDLEGVEKSAEAYPEWTDALRGSMQTEANAFIDRALWDENGSLDALFAGSFALVDAELAPIYGVTPPEAGSAEWRAADSERRAGILTLPAFLAKQSLGDQSSPVLRGAFVRERLFCQSLPSPPEGLVVVPPEPDPELSTRERYVQHRADPSCAACHELMDPIGFGLEHYDAIGRFRVAEENGQLVDARGEIVSTSDADGSFEGGVELARRIAESDDLRSCVARQWWRHALGRLESDGDACALDGVDAAFADAGYDLREIVVAIVRSEPFLHRRADAEVSP